MKKLFLLLGLLAFGYGATAQVLNVREMDVNLSDLTAKTKPRYDINQVACAVVRVAVVADTVAFDGTIVGPIERSQTGEYVVYMAAGSRYLKVAAKGFLPLKVNFLNYLPKALTSNYTYNLHLEHVEKGPTRVKKVRPKVDPAWILQPTFTFANNQVAYGLMAGWVKRAGVYVRAKSNFKFANVEDLENPNYYNLTGKTLKKRWAVTAGYVQRVIDPLFFYVGAGYGVRQYGFETKDGRYIMDKLPGSESTNSGAEVELGAILRLGKFALSAGVQTNSFNYYEANIGVGVMF